MKIYCAGCKDLIKPGEDFGEFRHKKYHKSENPTENCFYPLDLIEEDNEENEV